MTPILLFRSWTAVPVAFADDWWFMAHNTPMREHVTVLKKLVSNRVLVTKTKQAFAQALCVHMSQTKLGQLC